LARLKIRVEAEIAGRLCGGSCWFADADENEDPVAFGLVCVDGFDVVDNHKMRLKGSRWFNQIKAVASSWYPKDKSWEMMLLGGPDP